MKCQIPSSIFMIEKRNKKNVAITLLCATNLPKLIIQIKEVTDRCTICELFKTLKATMIFSPKHRYNNAHTKEVHKQAINNLCPGQIIKVQDFNENYTCLVPDEVQSLHWSRKQVTLFPAVSFRKNINDNLLEDQLVYVSNDKKHDCAFVKLVNAKIHEYYKQQGVKINLDIEFNDDCGSQFKSIKSFWLFAKRKVHTERIYFESSHGKGCAEKLIIRNGKELHVFLEESCTLENDPEIHCIMKRKFFLIEMDKINLFRKLLGKLPFKTRRYSVASNKMS